MVNALPIRVRLTAAFAGAMLLMLTAAAAFVYLRLRADLDDALNAQLRARFAAVAARTPGPTLAAVALADPEEGFVQVLDRQGRIIDQAGTTLAAALTPTQLQEASGDRLLIEQSVAGIDGTARILARAIPGRGPSAGVGAAGPAVLVVGASLNDRDEALRGVVTSFAAGGAVAVLLASAIGYLLARAGLAPVDAIRRRALEVSLVDADEGLPLPRARDEVRRLADTLNAMLVRLRASYERERRFVADASHELRTPIAVVKAELEAALRSGAIGAQVREGLVAAVEECDRLAQLADDLLVLARLSSDGPPVHRQPVDALTLLDGVRNRFTDRAEQRNRRITIAVAGMACFPADPDRVRQALSNLVDNALRHGHGDITVSCHATPAGTVLAVSDQGPGFAADITDRAFERFARGDLARTRGGAGLGLAIVAAVAASHGGTAQILPGSATVQVSLPTRQPDQT